MSRRNLVILLVLALTVVCLGVDQSWGQTATSTATVQQNQLKEAENAAAALRKSKGQMQSTTNDDKRAAAERNAARRAAVGNVQGNGGGQ